MKGCSDASTFPKPPYRERKEAYLAHLSTANPSVRLVSLADKIHNARSIFQDYVAVGEKLWERFTAGKEGTLWYYRKLVEAFRAGGRRVRPDPRAVLIDELDRLVCALERRTRADISSGRFFYADELSHPEDVRPYLARLSHWRDGYSAAAVAQSWIGNGDIPAAVRAALSTSTAFHDVTLIEASFEHRTRLRTPSGKSRTDVLALVGIGGRYAVLAVEGKCRETFGEKVSDWLKVKKATSPATEPSDPARARESRTRRARLEELCGVLGLDANKCGPLRYQLLHRTVAGVYEAKRYRCARAAVIVHSFTGDDHVGFDDFEAFTKALGVPVTKGRPRSADKDMNGVAVTLVWAKDRLVPATGLDDESLPFLERLRAEGLLDENDWSSIARWLADARAFLAQPDRTVTKGKDGEVVLDLDADPRTADWLRIVRVRRLTGRQVPGWAALWLWRLGHDRGSGFWSKIAKVARKELKESGHRRASRN